MVNCERMLHEFLELVKIAAPSRQERKVADLLKNRLKQMGLKVEEDDTGRKIGGNSGNIFAFLPGNVPGKPAILFTAHMDCVEPCEGIIPVLSDGVITSSGNTILGSDDKAGVVAIMEALRVVLEKKIPHGDVQIVFTVSEEGGLEGSKHLDKTRLQADFGYALDSGGTPGKIITKAPGQDHIAVVIHGKTAHAGVAPEDGINAIIVAGKALAQLKHGRIDDETTANVGIIRGGQATNIVPDRVELACEARSRDLNKLAEQTQHMKGIFEQTARENGCRAEVLVERAYGPYELSNDSPVVKLAVKAAEHIGLQPLLEATGGGSDANFFNNYGVPTAVLGVGMSKVHTTEEYIKETDLYKAGDLVIAILKTAAGN
ncbi:putative protein YqjE [Propionispora sp. 2/2-37]|uniref:M20/M25/M40 family metallo-hydrolase n=1 Tax=Propionispora sp. 2/2-37 TaxID=1677858 RepID=UPI0006BB8E35|nr:M20/M25/M40 family metallo-hydrolase [Propionispora sp. 2/2-37]CUH94605.1 putative protein YqjE [Propionispora sp. 2/2-37]